MSAETEVTYMKTQYSLLDFIFRNEKVTRLQSVAYVRCKLEQEIRNLVTNDTYGYIQEAFDKMQKKDNLIVSEYNIQPARVVPNKDDKFLLSKDGIIYLIKLREILDKPKKF